MAVCLWCTVLLEADQAHLDLALVALALGTWCVAYEVSIGSGYFVVVSDLAQGTSATLVFAVGNSVRFAAEFGSSVLFLPATQSYGVPATLSFHAIVTCVVALALLVTLPETNLRFKRPAHLL